MKKRIIAYGALAVVVCGVLVASFIYSSNSEKQNAQTIERSESEGAKIIAENPKEIKEAEVEQSAPTTTPVVPQRTAAVEQPASQTPTIPTTPEEIKAAARAAFLPNSANRNSPSEFRCFEQVINYLVIESAEFGGWNNYNHIMLVVDKTKDMHFVCFQAKDVLLSKVVNQYCARDETKPNRPLLGPLTCKWD